jgi:hypothetical protein
MQMTVSQLLQTAFAMADANYPSLADQWTAASHRVESAMNGTMVFKKVQDMGRIDVLSRALEGEERERLARSKPDFPNNNLAVLSAAFIGGIYAVVRALRDREQRKVQTNIATVSPRPTSIYCYMIWSWSAFPSKNSSFSRSASWQRLYRCSPCHT